MTKYYNAILCKFGKQLINIGYNNKQNISRLYLSLGRCWSSLCKESSGLNKTYHLAFLDQARLYFQCCIGYHR